MDKGKRVFGKKKEKEGSERSSVVGTRDQESRGRRGSGRRKERRKAEEGEKGEKTNKEFER